MGFLAPPCSVFLAASLVTISRTLLLMRLPGGASQYCFMAMAANPLTPPK